MTVVYLLHGTTSYTLPSDWNTAANTIEAIGEGGNGKSYNGYAAGGGAYSKISNLSDAAGTVETVQIGAGGSSTTTQFKNGSTLVADYGRSDNQSNGIGGSVSNCVGTTKYAGGNSGPLGALGSSNSCPGAGAAGGPNGAGANGGQDNGLATVNANYVIGGGGGGANGGYAGNQGTALTGPAGAGGNNRSNTDGGTGGATGYVNGANGTNGGGGGGDCGANNNAGKGGIDPVWDASHGPSGGMGGSKNNGGQINAGYGGGDGCDNYIGGGAPGIIVITYTPAATFNPAWATNSNQTFIGA